MSKLPPVRGSSLGAGTAHTDGAVEATPAARADNVTSTLAAFEGRRTDSDLAEFSSGTVVTLDPARKNACGTRYRGANANSTLAIVPATTAGL